MNKYYIKFDNKQITCEDICSIVQKIVNSHSNSLKDKVLVLEMKDITSTTDALIHKITFNPNLDSHQ